MSLAEANPTALIAHVNSAFTPAELDQIEQYGSSLLLGKAPLAHRPLSDHYDDLRITKVADIVRKSQTGWIYDRLAQVVAFLNQNYQFALSGYFENIQYMVYRDAEGGHFDWHVDQGPTFRRKLSLTVQLTDPAEYENCDLQFDNGGKIVTAPKTRGVVIAFPSHVRHRVTPITRGTRKSLVAWAWER